MFTDLASHVAYNSFSFLYTKVSSTMTTTGVVSIFNLSDPKAIAVADLAMSVSHAIIINTAKFLFKDEDMRVLCTLVSICASSYAFAKAGKLVDPGFHFWKSFSTSWGVYLVFDACKLYFNEVPQITES